MACVLPLRGYIARKKNESGKRSIVFNSKLGFTDQRVSLACGRCIGCRLERSRQWAIRCVHEASLWDVNMFVTLTFSDEAVNKSGSLVKEDFVLFMKRLRKFITQYEFDSGVGEYVKRKVKISKAQVRFYHCGEYGEVCARCNFSRVRCSCSVFASSLGRPHHHALLFGFDFQDKVLWKVTDGIKLFRSAKLEQLWPYGFASIGEVTFESAAYVARYVVKKITGKPAAAHYGGRLPEYTTMSRRPGIGKAWFDKYRSDVFPSDEVVIRGGVKCRVPRYYSRCFSLTNPEDYAVIISQRAKAVREGVRREPRRNMKVSRRGVERAEVAVAVVNQEALKMRLAQLKRGRVDE